MCVSCLIWDGNFSPTGAMQELLMLLHRCVELGASWCPGLRTVSSLLLLRPFCGRVPGAGGSFYPGAECSCQSPLFWEEGARARGYGCEYTAHVLFLPQNDDLELVGLGFTGNVEWGLLKPILKHPILLSSAWIWRNNNFFKTKWQCSWFFCNRMVTPRHHYFQLCGYTHRLC